MRALHAERSRTVVESRFEPRWATTHGLVGSGLAADAKGWAANHRLQRHVLARQSSNRAGTDSLRCSARAREYRCGRARPLVTPADIAVDDRWARRRGIGNCWEACWWADALDAERIRLHWLAQTKGRFESALESPRISSRLGVTCSRPWRSGASLRHLHLLWVQPAQQPGWRASYAAFAAHWPSRLSTARCPCRCRPWADSPRPA